MTPDIEKAIRESLLMAVRDRLAPYGTFKAKKTTGAPAPVTPAPGPPAPAASSSTTD